MIARTWRGWVQTDRAAEYVDYISETGLEEYCASPGNLGAQLFTRDLHDGRTEVVTVSWWNSLDEVHNFAGDDIDRAVFYPRDDEFLIEREHTVAHYHVALAPDDQDRPARVRDVPRIT
ncbi:MAG: hypothetical protein U0Q19_01540 [Kineosporiaceae bacterium]